jgi:hypothetical protein
MRPLRATALAALFICAAMQQATAQDNGQSVIAVPPAPPIVASPPSIPSQVLPAPSALPPPAPMPPPGLVQTPVPPADTDTNTDNGQTAPATPDQNTPPANNWVPGTTAKLGVLNKIDGSVTEISVAVGGQANVGDLQVSVLACVTRPPGEVPDAAIFLAAQNATDNAAAPLYRGWIVRSVPGAAVAGDASEIFRVIDCS